MLINVKVIYFMFVLKLLSSQVFQEKVSNQILAEPLDQETKSKQKCKCQNNGQCHSSTLQQYETDKKKQVYCRCSTSFIGQNCQTQAYEVAKNKQIQQKINIREYKFFYYQPKQQNMYSFSFDLCFDNKNSPNSVQEKYLQQQVTFFITAQNQDGRFQVDQVKLNPTTVTIDQDQCKYITVDYTVLLITKLKTVQKLIFAIKLGQKLDYRINKQKIADQNTKANDKNYNQTVNKLNNAKQLKSQENKIIVSDKFPENKPEAIIGKPTQKILSTKQTRNQQRVPLNEQKYLSNYHPISYSIQSKKRSSLPQKKEDQNGKKQNIKSMNQFKSKSPSKLKQSNDMYSSKTIYLILETYPFMIEYIVFNVIFSITALGAFVIVGMMIIFIRSKILGIRIMGTFSMSSTIINDLRHFDRYIPAELHSKKQRKQGDHSPNSSEVQCAICLVRFQELDFIRRTPCQHTFHKSCIDQWCHQNLNCPMCRKSLTEQNLIQFYCSTALQLKNSPQSD